LSDGIEVCAFERDDEVLDIKGAASLLKCASSTLYHYVSENRMPFIKMGTRTLFRRRDLLVWLDQHRRFPEGWENIKEMRL